MTTPNGSQCFLRYLPPMFLTMNRLMVGLFVVLLIGAVVFASERMLFLDAPFILFRLINFNELQIQEHRYGSFITQGFPLIAARLHLPLNVIVLLYSISFNLFYLSVALLLVYKFQQPTLALLMAFYYLLFVSDTYFWTNNEVHQGIAWMFLFFGCMLHMAKKGTSLWLVFPLFLLLGLLSIFTHPLVLFPLVFLWISFLLRKELHYPKTWLITFSIIIAVICYIKIQLSSAEASFYDSVKIHAATHLSFNRIFSAFSSIQAGEISQRILWNYWLIPALLFWGLYSAFRQKQFRLLWLTIVFTLGYFIAVCITFQDFIPFYSESEWMPLTIIVTSLFAFYTLPGIKPGRALLLIGFIFLVRLGYIGFASQKFVERKEWLTATLQTMREKKMTKAIVYEDDQNKKTVIMNWGVPAESMMASALANDNPQLTFVVGTPESLAGRITTNPNEMIGSFQTLSKETMNKIYFRFDTLSTYRPLR